MLVLMYIVVVSKPAVIIGTCIVYFLHLQLHKIVDCGKLTIHIYVHR